MNFRIKNEWWNLYVWHRCTSSPLSHQNVMLRPQKNDNKTVLTMRCCFYNTAHHNAMDIKWKALLKIFLCFAAFSLVNGFLPIVCWESTCHPRERLTKLSATSSRDLKKGNRSSASKVASRLAKASKEAAAIRVTKELVAAREAKQQQHEPELSNVVSLSEAIDKELLRPWDGYRRSPESSSMRVLLDHNEKTKEDKRRSKEERRDIALIFSKPLRDDQISTEYASRIVSLARAIKDDGYRPDLICFSGSTKPETGCVVSETAAGVVFFRHLCAANKISLEKVNIRIIKHDSDFSSWSSDSLRAVAKEIFRGRYLETWLQDSEVYESPTDEYGLTRREPRKKIHLHWTLISSDYHLCNVNDVHVRSPRQSPLNLLRQQVEQRVRSNNAILGNSWCFRYSTYPHLYSKDSVTAFLGQCYLLAQDLYPILVNIRAVTKQVSFFLLFCDKFQYLRLFVTNLCLHAAFVLLTTVGDIIFAR